MRVSHQDFSKSLKFLLDEIQAIQVSSDSRFMVSGSADRSIKIFDIENRKQIHHFKDAHEGSKRNLNFSLTKASIGSIRSIAISSDNKFIASGSNDKSIKLFDLNSKEMIYEFQKIHSSSFQPKYYFKFS